MFLSASFLKKNFSRAYLELSGCGMLKANSPALSFLIYFVL